MKIKNISTKIINIGTTALMPDDVMEVGKEMLQIPAIYAFSRMGLIEITETESQKSDIPQFFSEAEKPNTDNGVPTVMDDPAGEGEPDNEADAGLSETAKAGVGRRRSKKAHGESETTSDANHGE